MKQAKRKRGWVSPIFWCTYHWMRWLLPCTLNFPKSQRGVLARQLQHQTFAFYECLVQAAKLDDKLACLKQADCHLTELRTYVRLSRELNLLTPKQYEYAAETLTEIGRLLGGGIKKFTEPEA